MASLIGGHYTKNGLYQLPARVVLSLNGVGLGGDETHPDTITIVRDTRVFPDGEAPPDYHTFDPISSGISWEQYGDYWYTQRTDGNGSFKNAWNLNPAHYYQICNEQGGNDPWSYQRLIDIERAISRAANADGRRCCVLNLAGGSPGDFEMWKSLCVPFIMEAWENGNNIYGRHVYGGPELIDAMGNPFPGQPQRVIAELEYLKSIGYRGGVVLTECGFNGGYGTIPYLDFEWQVVDWQDALLPYADMLIGFCVWELGSTEFEANYTSHMQQLLPYLQIVDLPRWTAPVDDGEEDMKHKAIVVKLPQSMTIDEWRLATDKAFEFLHTVTPSHDDMLTILNGGSAESYVKFSHPERDTDAVALVVAAGYSWQPLYDVPPPVASINLTYRPCQTTSITQSFGANPDSYDDFGLPGHDGIDYGVAKDLPFYAASAGIVAHASDRKWSSSAASGYGWHVVLDHGDYCTVYAHARTDLPVSVGQSVAAGQVVGYSGNTGNSTGYHLHFGILDKTGTIDPDNGYPVWLHGRPINPAPFLDGKLPPSVTPPPSSTIDLLPWFRGGHRRQFDKEYKLTNGVTGTQTTQVFHLNNGNDWLYIKGEQGHYEHLGLRTWNGKEWIFRFEDTSEAQDRWYSHFMSDGDNIGAPWLPRFVEVGKWYETGKFVQHYSKDSNGNPICTKMNSGSVTDRLRVISEPYTKTYESGKVLQVVTAEWASGEQYDFAGGNVAFRNTAGDNFWFMQWLEGRADKTYKKVDCLPVGW